MSVDTTASAKPPGRYGARNWPPTDSTSPHWSATRPRSTVVDVGVWGRGPEPQSTDVIGGDDSQFRCPQVGRRLPSAVDPRVTRLGRSELATERRQHHHREPVGVRFAPRIRGDDTNADHVGIEKVQTSLEMVRPLHRIGRNRRPRRRIAGRLRIEQFGIEAERMAHAKRTFRGGLTRPSPDRPAQRQLGIGTPRQTFEWIRTQMDGPTFVREQLHMAPRRPGHYRPTHTRREVHRLAFGP